MNFGSQVWALLLTFVTRPTQVVVERPTLPAPSSCTFALSQEWRGDLTALFVLAFLGKPVIGHASAEQYVRACTRTHNRSSYSRGLSGGYFGRSPGHPGCGFLRGVRIGCGGLV